MKNFEFTIKGHKYNVDIKSFEYNIAEIEVNGTPYTVEVHKEFKASKTPTLVRKTVVTPKGSDKIQKSGGIASPVKAPLPGVIIQIFAKVGDSVSKGQNLLIMEAMKMENNVLSEKDGVVKSVKVATGDNVLQGDVLIEIE